MNRAAQGDDLMADPAARRAARRRRHVRVVAAFATSPSRRSSDGVLLATVHRVKGQEWPHVVVHLADAEQYPHRLADDVEEERRLFHVAITRASHHATIVTGPRPSPFVDELTTEPSERRIVSSHRPEPVAADQADRRTVVGRPGGVARRRRAAALRSAQGPAQRTARRQAGLRGVRQQDARGHRPRRADEQVGAVAHRRHRSGEARAVRRRRARPARHIAAD